MSPDDLLKQTEHDLIYVILLMIVALLIIAHTNREKLSSKKKQNLDQNGNK